MSGVDLFIFFAFFHMINNFEKHCRRSALNIYIAREAFKLPAATGNIFCIFMASPASMPYFYELASSRKTFNNATRITISTRAEVEDASGAEDEAVAEADGF